MTLRPALLLLALAGAAQAQDARPSVEALAARVAEAPNDAETRRTLAARYSEAGEPARAVPHLAWLAERDPTDTALLWTLARHLQWTDQGGRAVEVLGQIVAADPADLDARLALAEAVTWTGGADRAVTLLAAVADERPRDARVQRAYAFALHASGDEGAARGQYERALALDPDHAGMLLESGAIERWQGDWSVGQRRLREALAVQGERALDTEGRIRATDLLRGLRREHAPTITSGAERSTDSNAITRVSAPLRLAYTVNSRLGVGLALAWDRLSTARPDSATSAAATVVAPAVVYTPRRDVRLSAAAGVEAVPGGGAAFRLDAEATRTWAAPFFAVLGARLSTNTGRDGVETLDRRLRVTRVGGVAYAEPVAGLSLGAEATSLHYGDGNTRVVASATGRARVASWGVRAEGRPALALALAGGAIYEDSGTVYPSSVPYYTPDHLTTTSAGVVVEASPWRSLDLDVGVGAAHQGGPFPATSLDYHLRLGADLGVHRIDVDARRSGSDAYSVETVGLRFTTRFL